MSGFSTAFKADADWGATPASGAVAIIGSAGGIPALIELLERLPPKFPLPIIVAQHLSAEVPSILPLILGRSTHLPVTWAEDGERAEPGVVFIIPGGQQACIRFGRFALLPLPPSRSSWLACPDALLMSLASCYGENATAIVLSGALPVGIIGLDLLRKCGEFRMRYKELDDTAKTVYEGI